MKTTTLIARAAVGTPLAFVATTMLLLAAAVSAAVAESPTLTLPTGKDALKAEAAPAEPAVEEPTTLTRNWFGAGEKIAEIGLTIKLSLTQTYQDVARGSVYTHRHSGRYTGS
jgi:hypothetical protein